MAKKSKRMRTTKPSYEEEYNQFLDEQRILEFQARPDIEKLTGDEWAAVRLYFGIAGDEGNYTIRDRKLFRKRLTEGFSWRKLKAIAARQTGEQTGRIHQGRKRASVRFSGCRQRENAS